MTVVDIGANFGYFAVRASRLVRAEGRVFAVEPDAGNRAVLRANLWRNRCANTDVLAVAAYSENGHIQMMMNPAGGSGHWVEPAGGTVNWGREADAVPGVLVPCARLDDALSHSPVDVVKTDAQGADHLAIRGMEALLRRSPDVWVVAEFLPERPAVDGESPDGVLRYYEDLGFALHLLAPDGTMNAATRSEIIATGEQLDVQNLGLRWRDERRRGARAAHSRPPAYIPALDRARQGLAGGDWGEPSPHGRGGLLARRALRRVLRPYALRQAEVDASIVDTIQDTADHFHDVIGALERAAGVSPDATFLRLAETLDPDRVVEGDTEIGMMWVHRDDPFISGSILANRTWKPDVASLLRSRLRPGMAFVDVGAHVGYFSLLAAGLVGDEGRVVAVEADPANAAIARANLWRRTTRTAQVLPIVAYSETGHVLLASSPDVPTNGYVTQDADEPGVRLVPCARLDDVLDLDTVDVVKIDAEGSDHHVVRGMAETLGRSVDPLVVVEIFLAERALGEERPVDILASYREMGFTHSLLDAAGELVPATAEQILATGRPIEQLVLTRRP